MRGFGLRLLFVFMCLTWIFTVPLTPIIWIFTGKSLLKWYLFKIKVVGMLARIPDR